MNWLTSTSAPAAVALIRLMVGGVFLSEGIQKLLYLEAGPINVSIWATGGTPKRFGMGVVYSLFYA